jgi:hypothetical protein
VAIQVFGCTNPNAAGVVEAGLETRRAVVFRRPDARHYCFVALHVVLSVPGQGEGAVSVTWMLPVASVLELNEPLKVSVPMLAPFDVNVAVREKLLFETGTEAFVALTVVAAGQPLITYCTEYAVMVEPFTVNVT